VHREVWMDLAASSAVNLPITRASLRLVVVCIGVRSIRWTYWAARVQPRFTFTTNFVVFMLGSILRPACSLWAKYLRAAWNSTPVPC